MTITIELEELPFVLEQLNADRLYFGNGICDWWIPIEKW